MLFGLLKLVSLNEQLPLILKLVIPLLAYLNLVLGLFNLIPGLPLDGGNILKAIVWKITGNPNKGVLLASRFGQIFGLIAIVIGLLNVFNVIQFGSIWTILIGFFLLQNANLAAQSVKAQERLEGILAQDVIIQSAPIAPENLNLREFVNNYIIGQKEWKRFLLTDTEGKLSGILTVENLKTIPTSVWAQTPLTQIVDKVEDISLVPAKTPLLEVMQLMETKMLSELLVISEAEEVIGLIDKISIGQYLQKRSSPA